MNEIKEILNIVRPSNIQYSFHQLFPNCENNKLTVYLFGLVHIAIVLIIIFGIFLKPPYLKYYTMFLMGTLISYIIYDNRCIITEITDELSKMNTYPIKISIKTAKKYIYFQLVLSLFFIIYPHKSFYHLFYSESVL